MRPIDLTILTDARYVNPTATDAYIENVLLEDRLVQKALEAHGIYCERKSWDDPVFDWSSTTYALFRATWDYFDRFDAFFDWFQRTAKHTQFINAAPLIRWNIDKHYLRDLQQKGVHLPKTLFIERGEKLDLGQALKKAQTQLGFTAEEFVLKPCIAGGARHTYRFRHSAWEAHNAIFQQLIAHEAMLLQEFQENVVQKGEVSIMVFNGQFSHAILKMAKPGDFRVQDDFGGSVHHYRPSAAEIAFAQNVVAAAPEPPLYARVDIFEANDGQLALAELEIFEPELWFRFHKPAATYLAHAIKQRYFS
ncbi:MAG: hypothetical protein AAGB24_08845 [Bacteroidota bacterium]